MKFAINPKEAGVLKDLYRPARRGGGDSAPPPLKINAPIQIYVCDACYNPIFRLRIQ